MKVSDFLKHHGIISNPFMDEDAQSDSVFQDGCIESARHPAWDKIFGNPALPSTSIVFGEKGSGKTAMKIQMIREIDKYNQEHQDSQDFVIQYDDFNQFIEVFLQKITPKKSLLGNLLGKKESEEQLNQWELWEHIDAILTLGVTKLTEQALKGELNLKNLSKTQKWDFLILAALYNRMSGGQYELWKQLRDKLNVSWETKLASWKRYVFPIIWCVIFFSCIFGLWHMQWINASHFQKIYIWIALIIGTSIGFYPMYNRWRRQNKTAQNLLENLRVRSFDQVAMRSILLDMPNSRLVGQPLPTTHSDDRYSLLEKFSNLTKALGFKSIIILIDRVDEPHKISGSPKLMKIFIWSILDNKLLKYPDIAFKMLLPVELYDFTKIENNEFHQQSRLDKQNLIPNLIWTGPSLYDIINARLAACTDKTMVEVPETLDQWFTEDMTIDHLIKSLELVRTPRRVFKFLYDLMSEHAQSFTEQNPQWKISTRLFDEKLKDVL